MFATSCENVWVELSLQNQNPYCSAIIVSHLIMRMDKQVPERTYQLRIVLK